MKVKKARLLKIPHLAKIMRIIKRGAEAVIYDVGDAVLKYRVKKGYRIREIDESQRRRRTKREARIMTEARRIGVLVPRIIEVKEFEILMEKIEGKRLRDVAEELDEKTLREVCTKIGESIAKLHAHNLIHGDLTTSNFILRDKEVYFIDFGLAFRSKREEDKAYDLYVLKQALKATHFSKFELMWRAILDGYRRIYSEAKSILKRLEEIEKRGRYKERRKDAAAKVR